MRNQEIIAKADMALSDLASSGLLNPEQAEKFIRTVQVQPTILNQVRTVIMNAPKRNIDRIGFADRILMPATSATALDVNTSATNRRSKVTTAQIQLDTEEVIAEVRLPYDVIEDNIEQARMGLGVDGGTENSGKPVKGSFKDTIVDMIAGRVALDLEELALLGDTDSADAYLALTDGYLKRLTSNEVDHSGATITKTMFKNGLKALPKQYHRNLSTLRNMVSVNQEIEYRDSLSNRDTGLGDSIIEGFRGVFGYGVPVEKTPMMPEAKGMLVNPKNLIWGIQRKISMEVDKSITERVFIIVVTARIDFQIEDELGGVVYSNMG
jgi:hypothetical protein